MNPDLASSATSDAPSVHDDRPGVLHICVNTALGGTERGTLNAMRLMTEHGFRSTLACHGEGDQAALACEMGLDYVGCRFEWLQRTLHPGKLWRYATAMHRESRHIASICREKRISLLIPHGPAAAMYSRFAAASLKLPVIYHLHEAASPTKFSLLATRYFLPIVDRAVCISEASRQCALDHGIPAHKTQVLYNALNNPAYISSPPDPTPEVQGPGPHFGIVGMIVPLKGQHVFLEAARLLLKRFPTARFYIIGGLVHPDDQPYLDRLLEMSNTPPLAGHVTFTGLRRDVPRWMMAMDAMALCSVKPEGLGNVVMEALALGRKVVATNIGGQLEIIRQGETGLFVPPEDPQALADALTFMVESPDADAMALRGQEDVRRRFSMERFSAEFAQVYRELLASPPQR